MRKKQRFAFLAIGGLGLLAAIAPGLAAGIGTPASPPAAGQGATDIKGFIVEDIDWEINNDAEVDFVTFTITRDVTGRASVNASDLETTGDAVVRVRLEIGTGAGEDFVASTVSAWVACSVTNGLAMCEVEDEGILAAELSRVNIIAFDRTP